MSPSRVRGLIVAYYLSRFSPQSYDDFGFTTQKATHGHIGQVLDVKASTVKNWRDEFDAVHDNGRVGWYQRELGPSRRRVVEAFADLERTALQGIVREMLYGSSGRGPAGLESVLREIASTDGWDDGDAGVASRIQTGRRAERFFMSYHAREGKPVSGELEDTRDMACGYDFRIVDGENEYLVEVKGITEKSKSLLLTDKEWQVAREAGRKYYLVVVDLEKEKMQPIRNPADCLSPTQHVSTRVRVEWHVEAEKLST